MEKSYNKLSTQFRYSILALIVVQASRLIFSLIEGIPLMMNHDALIEKIRTTSPAELDMATVPKEFFVNSFMVTFVITIIVSILIIFLLVRKLSMESSGRYITKGVMILILILSLISVRQAILPATPIIDKVLTFVNLFLSAASVYLATVLNRTRVKKEKTRNVEVKNPDVIDPENYKH